MKILQHVVVISTLQHSFRQIRHVGCRICDAELYTEPPHDKNGVYWLPNRGQKKTRHIQSYHPLLKEDDWRIFSTQPQPWHDKAPWDPLIKTSMTSGNDNKPVDGVYCTLLECRRRKKRGWRSQYDWRLHVYEEHEYYALEKPTKSGPWATYER